MCSRGTQLQRQQRSTLESLPTADLLRAWGRCNDRFVSELLRREQLKTEAAQVESLFEELLAEEP